MLFIFLMHLPDSQGESTGFVTADVAFFCPLRRRQERLEFLYDSGLSTGKGTDEDYLLGKPLEDDKADSDFTKV